VFVAYIRVTFLGFISNVKMQILTTFNKQHCSSFTAGNGRLVLLCGSVHIRELLLLRDMPGIDNSCKVLTRTEIDFIVRYLANDELHVLQFF